MWEILRELAIHEILHFNGVWLPRRNGYYTLNGTSSHKYPAELPRVMLRATWPVLTNKRFIKFISALREAKPIALLRIKRECKKVRGERKKGIESKKEKNIEKQRIGYTEQSNREIKGGRSWEHKEETKEECEGNWDIYQREKGEWKLYTIGWSEWM